MHTRKASFRLPAIIICFAAVLMAACAEPEPWKNPCVEEGASMTEITMTERATDEQIWKVIEKYRDLFERQPHFYHVNPGVLDDENGDLIETTEGLVDENGHPLHVLGIRVKVEEITDQSTLPEEDRIPECLDGIPVQIELKLEGYLLGE